MILCKPVPFNSLSGSNLAPLQFTVVTTLCYSTPSHNLTYNRFKCAAVPDMSISCHKELNHNNSLPPTFVRWCERQRCKSSTIKWSKGYCATSVLTEEKKSLIFMFCCQIYCIINTIFHFWDLVKIKRKAHNCFNLSFYL